MQNDKSSLEIKLLKSIYSVDSSSQIPEVDSPTRS